MSQYIHFVTYLILASGTINLIQKMLFLIGSDLYELTNQQDKLRTKDAPPYLPSFSVVIPAHNEEGSILECIGSVLRCDYPKDKLEVIMIDDGSTDRTFPLAKDYKAANHLDQLLVITQKNSGKAHALNNGMKNFAKGELVMCLDADSTLHPEALKNAARYFRDPRVVALSANVKIRPNGKLFNLIQRYEYLICYQMKRAQTFFNVEYIIGGIGSTFRHSALREVGYYDTDTITEDIDLTMKFLCRGNRHNRVIYGSDVIAQTESVPDMKGLIRQRYRWKYGRCQTFFKNIHLFFAPHKKHTRRLTFVHLPFAIFSDIMFFLEPLMVFYIAYIIVYYQDYATLRSAFTVISAYIVMNILAENTLEWKERMKLAVMAPSMFFLFYLLSYAEYAALIKTYIRLDEVHGSIAENVCGWEHVDRDTGTNYSSAG